ncbi:MAG: hypothetical protein ACFCVK_11560 [Acidimicrobiales bacterium]
MTPSLATIDDRLDALHDGTAVGDLTPDQVTAATGLSHETIGAIWRTLGRTDLTPTTFSAGDLRLLTLIGALATTIDPTASDLTRLRPVLRTLRVATHALRRISDAHVTARLEHLTTDQDTTDLIDDIDRNCDTVEALLVEMWRHELRQSLARALTTNDNPTRPLLAVGFVDLAGYSARSQQLPTTDLIDLIDRFDTAAVEITAAHGATIIKTIGDEVMFTHPDPAAAACVTLDLVDRCANDEVMLAARSGLAWGRPVALGGDFYGPSVNLAARLVQLARPNTALINAELAALLEADPRFEIGSVQQPQRLRHCGTHHVYTLRRTPSSPEAGAMPASSPTDKETTP